MSEYKAGRELDALMAGVMGWTVAHYAPKGERAIGYVERDVLYYENADGTDVDGVKRSSLSSDWSYWSPSTNIAAAFEVVAKLLADGWGFDLRNYGTWTAVFEHEHKDCYVTEDGDTAPLAICRAALAAVANPTPTEP